MLQIYEQLAKFLFEDIILFQIFFNNFLYSDSII